MKDPGDSKFISAGNRLRRAIGRLFDAPPPRRIILAPGMLTSLRILLPALGVHRIALTDQEYYDSSHFPGLKVRTITAGQLNEMVRQVTRLRMDAVIASVVTWKGDLLPVAELFRQIRSTLKKRSPLLIADYLHAGAAGFPPARSFEADIVCGDVAKWVTPPFWESRLAFLWLPSERLLQAVRKVFQPYFLAVDTQHRSFSARWVSPTDVINVNQWLTQYKVSRSILLRRHAENLQLRSTLEAILGRALNSPSTATLWLPERDYKGEDRKLLRILARHTDVWSLPGQGLRIQCRAETLPAQLRHLLHRLEASIR